MYVQRVHCHSCLQPNSSTFPSVTHLIIRDNHVVVCVPLTYIYYPDGERDLTLTKVNMNVRFLTFNECVCEGSWRVCTMRVLVCRGDLGHRVGLSLRPFLEKRMWTGEKAWWRRTYSVTSHHCREMFGVHSLLHISWQNSSWNLFTQVLSSEGEGTQVNTHTYTHIHKQARQQPKDRCT